MMFILSQAFQRVRCYFEVYTTNDKSYSEGIVNCVFDKTAHCFNAGHCSITYEGNKVW